MTISRQTISIIVSIKANKEGNGVSRRTFKTKEAIQVFSKHLQPGEEKTHGELVEMLQKHIKGIGPTQCSGMIYRCRTNVDGILEKNGQVYSLAKNHTEIQDGLVEMDQKIRQVKEDIQNIPVAKFKTTEDFEKLQKGLYYLEKIKEEL